jgi:HK97 family phage major capsid protein
VSVTLELTESELRSEIKRTFEAAEAIERKYPDGPITNQEDETEVKRLLEFTDELEAKLALVEDAKSRRMRINDRIDHYSRPAEDMVHRDGASADRGLLSPGDQFIRHANYRHVVNSGLLNSKLNRIELLVDLKDGTSLIEWKSLMTKALVYSGSAVGGSFVQNDLRPGSLDILQRELNLLDLLPRLATDSDMIEYVREDTFTNNAAMVAEATATTGTSGLKPESVLAFSAQTSPVRTLAHWIPVTNRMLADAPAIRGIINSRLLLGLALELEDQIIDGDGTGENFTGILRTTGINIQGLGTDSIQDAIFKARTQVRVTGKARPTAVVLHPNDWQAVRLARENVATGTLGGYLFGPPSQGGAVTIWGLPVVESEGIPENTGLVGDFGMGATLFDREQSAIRVGLIDDQFVRNMQTILAELRAAFVVWRPTAFAKVTGI